MKTLRWLMFTILIVLAIFVTLFACEVYRVNGEIVSFWERQSQGIELVAVDSDLKKFVVYFTEDEPVTGKCEFKCLFIKRSLNQLSRQEKLSKRPNWFTKKFIYKFLPWWYTKEDMAMLSFNHIQIFGEKKDSKDPSLNSIYGFPSASKVYFKKNFESLEAHEISSLMAIAWLGSRSKSPEDLEQARNKILLQMREKQLIGDDVYNQQLKKPVLKIE